MEPTFKETDVFLLQFNSNFHFYTFESKDELYILSFLCCHLNLR